VLLDKEVCGELQRERDELVQRVKHFVVQALQRGQRWSCAAFFWPNSDDHQNRTHPGKALDLRQVLLQQLGVIPVASAIELLSCQSGAFQEDRSCSLGMLYTSTWSGRPPPTTLLPAGLYPLYSPFSRSGMYLFFSSSGSS
jgi:hypothetical protein